jgi:hypothetical protein
VCKPSEFSQKEFVFDEKTGSWLLGDLEGMVGGVTFIDVGSKKGFLLLMNADVEQLNGAVEVLLLMIKPFFREEFRAEIIEMIRK